MKGRCHMVGEDWNQTEDWNETWNDGFWADDQIGNDGYWVNDDLYYMDEHGYFHKKHT